MGSAARRSRAARLDRWAPWLGGVVLAAGVVAVLVTFFGSGSDGPPPPAAHPGASYVEPDRGTPVKPSRAVQAAAAEFIKTAVARRDLARGWQLTHPELRRDNTYREWLRGVSTVQPYQVDLAKAPPFKIDESYARSATFRVVLSPRKGAKLKPQIFFIGLKAVGTGSKKRWLVNYWAPYASIPVPAAE